MRSLGPPIQHLTVTATISVIVHRSRIFLDSRQYSVCTSTKVALHIKTKRATLRSIIAFRSSYTRLFPTNKRNELISVIHLTASPHIIKNISTSTLKSTHATTSQHRYTQGLTIQKKHTKQSALFLSLALGVKRGIEKAQISSRLGLGLLHHRGSGSGTSGSNRRGNRYRGVKLAGKATGERGGGVLGFDVNLGVSVCLGHSARLHAHRAVGHHSLHDHLARQPALSITYDNFDVKNTMF